MNSSSLGYKSLSCLSLVILLNGCTTWKALTFKEDKVNSGITENIKISVDSWYSSDLSDNCTAKAATNKPYGDGKNTNRPRSLPLSVAAAGATIIYNVVDNEVTNWVEAKKASFVKTYSVTTNFIPTTTKSDSVWALCILVERESISGQDSYSKIAYKILTDNNLGYSLVNIPYLKVSKALAITDSEGKFINVDSEIIISTQSQSNLDFKSVSPETMNINGVKLGKEYSNGSIQRRTRKNNDVISKSDPIDIKTRVFNALSVNKPIGITIKITESGTGADEYLRQGVFYKKLNEQYLIVSKDALNQAFEKK